MKMHRKSLTVKEIAETFGNGNYMVKSVHNYGQTRHYILVILNNQYFFIQPNKVATSPQFINNGDASKFILTENKPFYILKKFLATAGYIFLFAILTSCSEKRPLDNYLTTFEKSYNQKVDIDINFVDKMDNNIVGICYIYSSGYRKIELSNDFWNKTTRLGQEELLFHELGHCILNREHDSNMISYNGNSIPESIMFPYVFGANWYYSQRRDEYIQELFNINPAKKLLNNTKDIVIMN